ncbi:MAG: UDP-N-acetylmuramoyl-L-alanine--D-glutamate ligase [Bacteroidales bacterium]
MNRHWDLAVIGAGESGTGAAILANRKGLKVFVSDFSKIDLHYKNVLNHYGIQWEEGKHSEKEILSASRIVKSPGIPPWIGIIKKALQLQIPVIDEIEFAAAFTNAFKVCITGSNGKTTTALLTYYILKKAGLNVALAGNIGKSFARQVAENDHDYYVLEISSFQLDGLKDFRADIAVLLNITPDHLDRYNNRFEDYVKSKFRIINNQKKDDAFIYCKDDKSITDHLKVQQISSIMYSFTKENNSNCNAYLNSNKIMINMDEERFDMDTSDLSLAGLHNIYNGMAATIASKLVDVRKEVIKQSLEEFENIGHRLEFVSRVRGIDFINDSKATNVNAAWYALESMTKPVVWIAGGVDKGNDYDMLKDLIRTKVKAIVCLGKDNSKIKDNLQNFVPELVETHTMNDAVQSAYFLAEQGDVVLLSPACASFDLFKNYEDRGSKFKQAVYDL